MWTAPTRYGVECVWCRMLVKLLDTFGSPSSTCHDEIFNLQCSPSYHADARCLSRINESEIPCTKPVAYIDWRLSYFPDVHQKEFYTSSVPPELIEEQPSHVSGTLRIKVRMKTRKYIIAVFLISTILRSQLEQTRYLKLHPSCHPG